MKMLHYIIVKWNNDVDKKSTLEKVRELYANAADIEGVNGVTIKENFTPRDNRYDLMIVLDMEAEALSIWDNSRLHKTWKADFGAMIEKKCIFDSES